jgi:c-di-GMP-related signal transduction protein
MLESQKNVPNPMTGGGINTGESQPHGVVTQVLGIATDSAPIREEELRARFLSFEPIFNADSRLVANELLLKGRLTSEEQNSKALAQLDEDMLLTGLYSLVQDGLSGDLPLFVRISADLVQTGVPEQINYPRLIWIVPVINQAALERARELKRSGLQICLDMNSSPSTLKLEAGEWAYLQYGAAASLPSTPLAAQLIIENIRYADTLAQWPVESWFKGSLFTGETAQPSREMEHRLELLAIAMRHPLETLIHFFKLNPDMEPRFLQIANSSAGGLSRPAESAAHALIILGQQRSQRIAILAALAGTTTTENSRLYAKVALIRALFMGKVTRLGAPAENAAIAFEIGLLSTLPHALELSTVALVRRLGLDPVVARALGGWATPENQLLKLAHACEENNAELMLHYSRDLNIDMQDISAAYLEAVVAGQVLEAALS